VGRYQDTTNKEHGFLLAAGRFSTIDFPGAVLTRAFGINSPGQIVGFYEDTTLKRHGFLLAAGSFSTIDFPGAVNTEAFGINSRGQIVGFYQDVKFHGFLATPTHKRPK
jgi:probable HAF family extracellular repeat protein